ncbi:glycosyltransferase family 4 protein [Shimia abyssi]|nr:glycosyltransferase family 1 protein [Shimia abyssi]
MRALLARLRGDVAWGQRSVGVEMLCRIAGSMRPAAEAELRRLCIGRATPSFLSRMLRRHLPEATVYVNVDHANLGARKLHAIRELTGARITVFVHDTIPLDHPELQTPESREKFAAFLRLVQSQADLILTNSQVSRDAILRHGSTNAPEVVVAHLGVETPVASDVSDLKLPDRYVMFLGTIEPRKNLSMLLDVWDRMVETRAEDDIPHLVICGRRGWMVDELTARLDASPLRGKLLHEFNDLDDAQIFGVLRGARAMVYPTLVEGYGLPAVESAMLGTPLICNDLPVIREILQKYPIYAKVSDSYSWETAILSLAAKQPASERTGGQTEIRFEPPSWDAHFNTVLKVT